MTVPWCVRRAELIFKCAKGFMIESGTWGGAELRYYLFHILIINANNMFTLHNYFSTLQLLLPRDISEELFSTLVGMVPHVFRVANAKILEDSTK